ncbi:MAG: chemotaxis protein CheX [Aquincola sp.]|uniref:chemotaxis protein CheX n=1 Tax=uncultured Aquincola sp. TaxID=886556 RepID=UPI0032B1DD49|nr:chemotaxis protein CheX [Aquincola sp.]|tara:strand:- start:488 stop:1450 length:963 start_codon:yes stop_codon:yes gene_type:complete
MSETTFLAAKVLLLEHDPVHYASLLEFCENLGLITVPRAAADALDALKQHKDLGGVLLAEDLHEDGSDSLPLAIALHRQRPELPIFLRRTSSRPLTDDEARAVTHPWPSGDMAALRELIDHSLFGLRYPTTLVGGVVELSCNAIRSMFPNAEVVAEPPYVVHDRIIYGQVSTLIALESTWCRGYMMLQTEEGALRQGMAQGMGYEGVGGDLGFRELNNLLGETTNLVWGAFKNRYIPPEAFANQQTQVPIVINHEQKYISFGSQDPQLCIRYLLTDPRRPRQPPVTIVQRFIFNLLFVPEAFVEFSAGNSTAATGELEFF